MMPGRREDDQADDGPCDRTLTCSDCGQPFVWPVRDQERCEAKGWVPPKRCPPCRRLVRELKAAGQWW